MSSTFPRQMKNLRPALLLALNGLFAVPAAYAQPANPQLAAPALRQPGAAPISYGLPLADSLVALLGQLKRSDRASLSSLEQPSITTAMRPRLGADQFDLLQYYGGTTLRLCYLRTNSQTKAVGRRVKAAFERLAAGGPFTQGEGGQHSSSLLENGREVFSYWLLDDATLEHNLVISVQQRSPPRPVLADEAAYGGRFPAAPTASATPQIWQVAGGPGTAAGAYVRYNGLAVRGVLLRGTKTFHGFSPFLDGTWQSDEWGPATSTIGVVLHPPDGSAEVKGRCQDQERMQDFSPSSSAPYFYDSESAPKNARLWGSLRPGAPPWLTYGFGWREQQAAAALKARQDQYVRDHPYVPAAPVNGSPAGQSERRTYEHEVTTTCSSCGGSGYVDYTDYHTSRSSRQRCTACGGTGKTTRSYRY